MGLDTWCGGAIFSGKYSSSYRPTGASQVVVSLDIENTTKTENVGRAHVRTRVGL